MSRPSHADSQRLISLLDDFNQGLEVLSWLTEDNLIVISSRKEDYSKILDPELVECLLVHLDLLQKFNKKNPETDGHVIDLEEKSDNISDDAYEIADSLEKNTIEVTRWLTTDKDSFKFLSQSMNICNSGVPGFLEASKDLRRLYLTKLITPVEEELSRERELEEIDAKLKKAKAEEAENIKKLSELKEQKRLGSESRTSETQKLRIEIERNERETNDAIKDIKKKTDTKIARLNKEYDDKEKEHLENRDKLTEILKNLRLENKKNEEDMIRVKQKNQIGKIAGIIREYDNEMIENAQQFDREKKAFDENKAALEEEEAHIRELRMEKARIDEENKRETIKAKNFEALQKQKELASAYIAAHWKGLKSRQDYEKLKKTKKKRRGGKK